MDFDECFDSNTRTITDPEVQKQVERLGSYTEVSPSGTGLRVVVRGSVPDNVNRGGVEIYCGSGALQQVTITGDHLTDTPTVITEGGEALTELYEKYKKTASAGDADFKIDESEPPVILDDYGLRVWYGEEPVSKPDDTPDRSATLQKIAYVLAEVGASLATIRRAVADRDAALGYRKYLDRPDERAEREYSRIAVKAVRETGGKRADYSGVVERFVQRNASGEGIVSAAELLSKEFAPIRWTVPGILPEGVTILGGKPKIGKSWLAFDLALGVSTRGTVLGDTDVERGPNPGIGARRQRAAAAAASQGAHEQRDGQS